MDYTLIGRVDVSLQGQLAWIWYADSAEAFIVGDDRKSFRIPNAAPDAAESLFPARPLQTISYPDSHACNLPIPDVLYDEFRVQPWHGLEFLTPSDYDRARDSQRCAIGDVLRTLTCMPDYGLYMRHPATGAILALYSGKLQLVRDDGSGFEIVAETKTRGRSALAFAAHPGKGLLVYGDNYGGFFAQEFTTQSFDRTRKVADKTRKAAAAEFIDDGAVLLIGGTGYVTAFECASGKLTQIAEVSAAVRELHWLAEERLLFINQGLNGVAIYRFEGAGFARAGGWKPDHPIGAAAVSPSGQYLASVTHAGEAVLVYRRT